MNSYYNELKSLIIKKGFKIQQTANALNLSLSSFFRKMKNGKFTAQEIKKLMGLFGKDEVYKIFFT